MGIDRLTITLNQEATGTTGATKGTNNPSVSTTVNKTPGKRGMAVKSRFRQ